MKILLVVKSKVMENLGVMYLSSVVKQCGHDCRIVDINGMTDEFWSWQPNIIGMSIMTGSQIEFKTKAMEIISLRHTHGLDVPIIIGGPHPTFFSDDCSWADMIIPGEAEQEIADILQSGIKYPNIDDLPWPDRVDFPNMPIRDFISSRGCPHNCLTGDTIIHTINGDFPIRELSGKQGIKVLSRDPETHRAVYVDAINIGLRQKNAEIVRVHFDDGTHIDCTPDHKFKVFRYKNQYDLSEKECDVPAIKLKHKQQVRAISFDDDNKRVVLSTARRNRILRSIAVMECKIGRRLFSHEVVHHADRNKTNDSPDNLILTTNKDHIPLWHPEVSERMKKNNPIRNIPKEVLSERASRIFTGRNQDLRERLLRREAQLGEKNSNYKDGVAAASQNKPSRISELSKDVNHKIVKVELLSHKEDVYCMEIPKIHWFYANKVLVHNCAYCYNDRWSKMHGDVDRVRIRSAKDVCKEIASVNPNFAYFQDSCFGVQMKWLEEFNENYCKIPYHCHLRPAQVTKDRVNLLWRSNCYSIRMALESASDRLRVLMNRPKLDTNNVINASSLLKDAGIKFMIQNILAIPTSTIEDDLATLEFNIRCKPDYAWSSIFAPYPGTVLGDMCVEKGWYNGSYSDITDSFFDRSVLNFSEQYIEHTYVLQKVFALCVEAEYMPEEDELSVQNMPMIIHKAMRKVGDKKLYGGII